MSEHLPEVHEEVARLVRALPVIRRVQASDRALIGALMRGLSPPTRFRRFHATMSELPSTLLDRLSQVDMPGEVALLATTRSRGREVAVGEARYAPSVEDGAKREFAIVVSDPWQRMGLGTALLSALVQHARRRAVTTLYGDTFVDNVAMIALARRLGFDCTPHPGDWALLRTSIRLNAGEVEIQE